MKICTKCKTAKGLDEFNKHNITQDGFSAWCKPCAKEGKKRWYAKNKAAQKQRVINWRARKVEENRDYLAKYTRERYLNDNVFRARRLSYNLLRRCLNGKAKESSTFELLGYTLQQFVEKFEDEIFVFKMYGVSFHVDHCIPLTWFIDGTPFNLVNDLDNLQVICADENREKKNVYAHPVPKAYIEKVLPHIKPERISKILAALCSAG